MAVAGPDYQCLYAGVGNNGRVNDGGGWNKCVISSAMETKTLYILSTRFLPLGQTKVLVVFLGDSAFALKIVMMETVPTTESHNWQANIQLFCWNILFGILANRWRVFLTTISLPPESIENLVLTSLIYLYFIKGLQEASTDL